MANHEISMPEECLACIEAAARGKFVKTAEQAVNCQVISFVPEERLNELPCASLTKLGGSGKYNISEEVFNKRYSMAPVWPQGKLVG